MNAKRRTTTDDGGGGDGGAKIFPRNLYLVAAVDSVKFVEIGIVLAIFWLFGVFGRFRSCAGGKGEPMVAAGFRPTAERTGRGKKHSHTPNPKGSVDDRKRSDALDVPLVPISIRKLG